MTVETVAGTTIGISAAAPATFTASGYAALTFTTIGEITDGGQHGKTSALVTHSPIGTRVVQKFKGSVNQGQKTLQLAIDKDDAGQILLDEAVDSDEDYFFKVEYQGGDVDYFPAKVMSFVKNAAGVDTIRSGTVSLELTSSKTGVGIIEVPAT
jgi:hypothetical protein